MKNKSIILLVLILFLGIGLGLNFSEAKSVNSKSEKKTASAKGRIDGYNFLGTEFSYYKIPQNLSQEELIAIAERLHEAEPEANLVLVDDDSKVRDYIAFAKIVNPSYNDPEMPKEWADKHIVANVQRHGNDKVVLCEGYGNRQIAELK